MTEQPERVAESERQSKETTVYVRVNLDGTGETEIDTKVPFFSHMLAMLSKHGHIDLTVNATGDLDHHVVEDTAIVLAQAIREALADMKGIYRFGQHYVPMDETLARVVIDLSGRPWYVGDLKTEGLDIEGMKIEDIAHFFVTFAQNLKANVHVEVLYGENDHHKVEAAMKALALALRMAVKVEGTELPTTKGLLD